jgi:hypothetical protein
MAPHLVSSIFFGLLVASVVPLAAQGQQAWLVDSDRDQLFSVDLTTGAATLVGSTAGILGTPAGLTWRADTRTLWTLDLAGGEVGTIDTVTAAFTMVYTANPTAGWQGIDWDPATQRFYLLNQDFNMYSLDPATGATTLLGATGAPLMTAIETDANGVLWGIGFSNGTLYHVNKTTGAATPVVTTTPVNFQGLAFDSAGVLYGANTTTDSLYRIDPVTGVTTLIGAHGAGVAFAKGFEIENGCTGAFVVSGVGCADFANVTVRMSRRGLPCIGETVNLGATQGQTGASFALTLGTSTQNWGPIVLPLSLAPFGNPGCSIYANHAVVLGLLQSTATLPIAIPNDPTLSGLNVHFQAMVIDARLPGLGVATSDLLTMRVGT